MNRYGYLIRLKPEKQEEYIRLHADVPAAVLSMIHDCGIRNYTIYLRDGMLFSHFEYHGTDFEADMAKMAADPATQEWWKLTDPCQEPIERHQPGEWWASMQEVFHTD